MTAPQPNNENERLTLEFFATLGSGDLEGVRALLHEDATWTPMVKDIPGAGKHIGRKGIVDDFLMPIRGMFRPGDPKVLVDTIASNGSLVITETRGKGALADGLLTTISTVGLLNSRMARSLRSVNTWIACMSRACLREPRGSP